MTVVKKKVELPGKVTYVKYSEAKPGQTLVLGTYLGTKMVPNFNKDGEVPSHSFETDAGTVVLNSASRLNKLLEQVDNGTPIEIVFLGTEKKKSKSGQHYKENTFEVNILEASK